jgi:hypothetical protein
MIAVTPINRVNIFEIGGVDLVVFFIILASGFGLYVLLKPPVYSYEEQETEYEVLPELKISSISLPDYSKQHKED